MHGALLMPSGSPAGIAERHGGNEGKHVLDMAAFRQVRLELPETDEAFFPVTPGELAGWGSPQGALAAAERFADGGRASVNPQELRLLLKRELDLDGDGQTEQYTLRDGKVTVQVDSRIVWQSPDDWWVDYFFLGDANNDGILDLNLLVWKEGSFGPRMPFWLTEDDPSIKNHLFIFKLEGDAFKPVWQSSNLDQPNYRAALLDLNGDGENELLVLEGSYTNPAEVKITLWKWNGWGFAAENSL